MWGKIYLIFYTAILKNYLSAHGRVLRLPFPFFVAGSRLELELPYGGSRRLPIIYAKHYLNLPHPS